jgi:SAM-dependent methyltransferase
LSKQRHSGRVTVKNTDITELLPFSDKPFDLVIAAGVLQHLGVLPVIENLSCFLKPGGYFFYTGVTNNWVGKAIGKFWRFKPYPEKLLLSWLKKAGFDLVKSVRLHRKYLMFVVKKAHLFKYCRLTS